MKEESIERIAQELLKEFRRYRRGKWVSRAVWILVLVVLVATPSLKDLAYDRGNHTALIDLQGVIGIGEEASADRINEGLRNAFENSHVKGILIRINSPGGSPVQSRQINQEIDRLQSLHPDVPVYAVVEEICASGGYYAAVAADEIYADPASIVGSIGVRLDSFGFVDAMEKLGIERRLITAGENKGLLDPFLPLEEDDREFAREMVDTVHRQFISAVREGRGDRLESGDARIFSGLIWSGEDALGLGLVDGFGSVDSVARDVIGEENIVNYTPGFGLWEHVAREVRAAVSAGVAAWLSSGDARLR